LYSNSNALGYYLNMHHKLSKYGISRVTSSELLGQEEAACICMYPPTLKFASVVIQLSWADLLLQQYHHPSIRMYHCLQFFTVATLYQLLHNSCCQHEAHNHEGQWDAYCQICDVLILIHIFIVLLGLMVGRQTE